MSMMEKLVEQRVCLKFCVSNKIPCAESLKMLQKTYNESCMSKTQAYEWYKAFKEGRDVVYDLPRSGRPSTSTNDANIAKIKQLVLENRRMSLRELAQEVNMSLKSVHNIMIDILGIKRVASRLVPKELNFVQKEHRKQFAEDMSARVTTDPTFIKRIITGDETWVYEYDIQTGQQSSEWCFENGSTAKKPRQIHSKIKVMLVVFFDYRGVVQSEFLTENQRMNKEYYLDVMRRLRENIRQKRQDLWEANSWILHHDNTPSHKAIVVQEFLAENSTNVIDQTPYSPDMAPCDFFLFPKLKLLLRGKRFETIAAIKENSLKELMEIPQSAYEKCMEDWVKRWHSCIVLDGAYYEGDKKFFDNIDDI
ncbi:protein GVQW3-like [Teleopsis dalmanni]|uniref:protein GVQW3-like n=1 Tax=Teleopsis dalmanni TaxID=139649 RepID=UPI0018CF1FDA|nr:protein GVQW3-like [Teleopsis dalmanni]